MLWGRFGDELLVAAFFDAANYPSLEWLIVAQFAATI
jgi:hypothetical protein